MSLNLIALRNGILGDWFYYKMIAIITGILNETGAYDKALNRLCCLQIFIANQMRHLHSNKKQAILLSFLIVNYIF